MDRNNMMMGRGAIYASGENEQDGNYIGSQSIFGLNRKYGSNTKNSILNRFKKSAYLWPFIILITFGIIYFLNEKYQNLERSNIYRCFGLIMFLVLLYNFIKYIKELNNYKKMAKEDKNELLELLKSLNITREEFGKNYILMNKFIKKRIKYHNITSDEYMNYVFPYLKKYLGKEKYLVIKKDSINDENYNSFWKEI